ncbi:hypothetical protein ACH4PU_30810 [Streptomyces sp. NPDC021100]
MDTKGLEEKVAAQPAVGAGYGKCEACDVPLEQHCQVCDGGWW